MNWYREGGVRKNSLQMSLQSSNQVWMTLFMVLDGGWRRPPSAYDNLPTEERRTGLRNRYIRST